MITNNPAEITIKSKQWLRSLVVLCFITVIVAACFFIFSSYDVLCQWYFSLDPDFGFHEIWKSQYFTPTVKSAGNKWCVSAILIAIGGVFYTIKNKRKTIAGVTKSPLIVIEKPDVLYLAGLLIMATSSSLWVKTKVYPGFDEVFSALECAGSHPFQCISYYIAPNNHLLFNLINSVFFHFAKDKVVTGRFISLIAYMGVAKVAYFWFRRIFNKKWLAALATLAILMQLMTWIFSTQARGYSLYLLAGWVCIASLFFYADDKDKRWMVIHAFSTAIGYMTIPSFFYFHGALLLFAGLYQLQQQQPDLCFWKYQVFSGVAVFFFYLPTLCFSGFEMLAHNNWVAGLRTVGYAAFIGEELDTLKSYACVCFSISYQYKDWVFIILLLPVFLLLTKAHRKAKAFILFYLSSIFTFILLAYMMRRMPFDRVLIIHFSMIYTAFIIAMVYFINAFKNVGPIIKNGVIVLLLSCSIMWCVIENPAKANTIYGSDIHAAFSNDTAVLNFVPEASSIAFSKNCWYAYYLRTQSHKQAAQKIMGNEDYLFKNAKDTVSKVIMQCYQPIKAVEDDTLYKRHR